MPMSCETATVIFSSKGRARMRSLLSYRGISCRLTLVEEGVSPSPSVATLRTKPSRLKRSTSTCIARTSRGLKKIGNCGVTVVFEMVYLVVRKRHGRFLVLCRMVGLGCALRCSRQLA